MARAPDGATPESSDPANGAGNEPATDAESPARTADDERGAAVDPDERVVESYVEDIRIVEVPDEDGDAVYRFEAPRHCGKEFEDREQAELYADVYFDAGGFREESTGEVGVPAGLFQAGNDTLAAYLLALPSTDREWVRSFYGVDDDELDQFLGWVRARAEESRERAREAQS